MSNDPQVETESYGFSSYEVINPEKPSSINFNADTLWRGDDTQAGIRGNLLMDPDNQRVISSIDSDNELRGRFVTRYQNLLGSLGNACRNLGVEQPQFSDSDRKELVLMAFRIETDGTAYAQRVRRVADQQFPTDPGKAKILGVKQILHYVGIEGAIIQHLADKQRGRSASGEFKLIGTELSEQQLEEEINSLVNEPLSPMEKPRSKDGMNGRRVIISGEPNYMFQGRTYGKELSKKDEELFRVYFQVEKEDIPKVVGILKEVGTKRGQRGEGLNFKYLAAKFEKNDFPTGMTSGVYKNLTDEDPRVVVYFESKDERVKFLRELLSDEGYHNQIVEFSNKRRNPDGSYKARRPGSNSFFDSKTGEELRAINYTEGGFSEDVLDRYGEQWRVHVRGSPTRALNN